MCMMCIVDGKQYSMEVAEYIVGAKLYSMHTATYIRLYIETSIVAQKCFQCRS
jgi:hypothetical protein